MMYDRYSVCTIKAQSSVDRSIPPVKIKTINDQTVKRTSILMKVTEFRDYFKFRISQLIPQLRSNPVLVQDRAEKGCIRYKHPSFRFFVANNLDLIYNRCALDIGVINYTVTLIARSGMIFFSSKFVINFTSTSRKDEANFRFI